MFNDVGDTDTDADGVCDLSDTCSLDAENDADGDDICGNTDNLKRLEVSKISVKPSECAMGKLNI